MLAGLQLIGKHTQWLYI